MSATKLATPNQVDNAQRHADLEAAAEVLELEAQGLRKLAENLGDELIQALDVLANAKGRIIVTGMGKNGHIGHKIAATMASTGTPAFFVHPGEASHGDLGMITTDDAILALSNSGETRELSDVIAHSRRFAIPLIAITGKRGSALDEAADITLLLPDTPEACPMGLAPTTSTTAALGLGDALAVALLNRKGFSASDFRQLHPGGRLGGMLLKVEDLMHSDDEMPVIAHDAAMADALIIMTAKRFGCVGVTVADGTLVGVVTDGDLRRHMHPSLLEKAVAEVMTKSPKTIRRAALASEAVQVMNANAITTLFVVEDDKPVGIIHLHDCLSAGVV
jgi:arabinose-5-phosphate isomerase